MRPLWGLPCKGHAEPSSPDGNLTGRVRAPLAALQNCSPVVKRGCEEPPHRPWGLPSSIPTDHCWQPGCPEWVWLAHRLESPRSLGWAWRVQSWLHLLLEAWPCTGDSAQPPTLSLRFPPASLDDGRVSALGCGHCLSHRFPAGPGSVLTHRHLSEFSSRSLFCRPGGVRKGVGVRQGHTAEPRTQNPVSGCQAGLSVDPRCLPGPPHCSLRLPRLLGSHSAPGGSFHPVSRMPGTPWGLWLWGLPGGWEGP